MTDSRTNAFLTVACALHCASADKAHEGELAKAKAILRDDPTIAGSNIYCAAVTGEIATLRQFVEDAGSAGVSLIERGGPRDWDPLLYLCFSRFLRDFDEPERARQIVSCAEILLQNGADPNTFFMLNDERETAIYASCGVCNYEPLTRLLLKHGAEVNDEDASYHVAEFFDHGCLRALIENGMDAQRLATTLLRKLDFDDPEGVNIILQSGHDPNTLGNWDHTAIQHAIMRGRDLDTIKILIMHGAKPELASKKWPSTYYLAGSHGRSDVLELMTAAGNEIELSLTQRYVVACATGNQHDATALRRSNPDLLESLSDEERLAICRTAKNGNIRGVSLMLDHGFDIAQPDELGFTPLHWAAWYGHIDLVRFLVDKGAPLEAKNNYGGSVIDSTIWGYANSDGRDKHCEVILEILLDAGANLKAVAPYPSGHKRCDAFLATYSDRSRERD